MFNRNFLLGFLGGAIAGAAGYKLYEQNGGQLQSLIQGMGMDMPGTTSCETPMNTVEPDLAELISQKERLEDLIAEHAINEDK